MNVINNDFLLTIGFKQVEGSFENYLFNGTLRTYPEFKDREGLRRWELESPNGYVVSIPIELRPKTPEQVLRFIQYIQDIDDSIAEEEG